MFDFDRIDLQRIAFSAVGALILSTTVVGAAVGPAYAVETGPAVSYAAVQASGQASHQASA